MGGLFSLLLGIGFTRENSILGLTFRIISCVHGVQTGFFCKPYSI